MIVLHTIIFFRANLLEWFDELTTSGLVLSIRPERVEGGEGEWFSVFSDDKQIVKC